MPFPANKKKILKESVTRLLQLGISDADIIDNLQSVGVEEPLAKEILRETKGDLAGKAAKQSSAKIAEIKDLAKPSERKPEEKKQEAKAAPPETEESEQELVEEVYEDADRSDAGAEEPGSLDDLKSSIEQGSAEQAKPSKKPASQQNPVKNLPPAPVVQEGSGSDISGLWEKGIIATVDAKLTEMENIRRDLDAVLDQKISDKMKAEAKKIEAVLESQRTLFYNKIDTHLESKSEELKNVVSAQSKQLQDVNARAADALSRLQAEKKFNSELLNTLNEKISGIETLRSQMISQVNQAQLQQDLKFKTFMDDSAKKRDELEARISRSLQLESKIAEGLIEDAKNRIESMRLEKDAELSKRINEKMKELDDITAKLDPKGLIESSKRIKVLDEQVTRKMGEIDSRLDQKIADVDRQIEEEISGVRSDLEKGEEERFSELKDEYAGTMDEMFSQELDVWDKRIKAKEAEVEDIKARIDLEKFNATLESLDLFKEQFVNTISKSIDDYNKAKKELAERVMARDKAINEYLKKIDSKLAEMTEFQRKFSKEFTDVLSEMQDAEQKKAKKA